MSQNSSELTGLFIVLVNQYFTVAKTWHPSVKCIVHNKYSFYCYISIAMDFIGTGLLACNQTSLTVVICI